jgi:hypothetical protein
VRAHPTQHSYAEPSLGCPTSCGSTGQDPIPVGNPRLHVSGGPSLLIPSSLIKVGFNAKRFTRADLVFTGVDPSAGSYEVLVFLNNRGATDTTAHDVEQG